MEFNDLILKISLAPNSVKKNFYNLYFNIRNSELVLKQIYSNKEYKSILNSISLDNLKNELKKKSINYITYENEYYPKQLSEIYDFPITLYYKGNIEILKKANMLSIVGTRKVTSYGKGLLVEIFNDLIDKDIIIVSGLAYGVDVISHKLAIDNNIDTIAILPFGVSSASPVGNSAVYNSIIKKNGLIISDVAPTEISHKGLYPRRNRIIAAMSMKTLVIEAGIKSGALITAKLAFDYNREVFAFPGNTTNLLSKGCNYLIKNNIAQLIEYISDIGLSTKSHQKVILSADESKIYYAILHEPKSINALSKQLGKDIAELSAICTKMQINGILNTDNLNKLYLI
jgi:DNA processing protein